MTRTLGEPKKVCGTRDLQRLPSQFEVVRERKPNEWCSLSRVLEDLMIGRAAPEALSNCTVVDVTAHCNQPWSPMVNLLKHGRFFVRLLGLEFL